LRGALITGTDTGVGKTVLAAVIVAALRARGVQVRVLKPVITGLDEPADGGWPADHELLAGLAGVTPEEVAPIGYGLAVSPPLAAEMAGRPIDVEQLRAILARAASGPEVLIVEGVGGLLVPLTDNYSVRELASDAGLPVLIAARPGLGTINHTLLTLESARAAGLDVAGVVLTPWPLEPDEIERSNLETIARLGHVDVAPLRRIEAPLPDQLAAAAESLPLERWLR
jgi:dethiobiotin synthetase